MLCVFNTVNTLEKLGCTVSTVYSIQFWPYSNDRSKWDHRLHRRDVNSNLRDADLLSDLVWEVILLLEEQCIRQIPQCDDRLNDSDRKE